MGLRQTVSESVRIVKDAFGFEPEFPTGLAAYRVGLTQELARLQQLLGEAQKACEEKDELIAKLQAACAIKDDMIADGSAYYIKKEGILDGPFCTSCFQRNHEMTRIVLAPKPSGADKCSADWVQCAKCQTPFRCDRISGYLSPSKTISTETPAPPGGSGEAKPAKARRKPRTPHRQPKN